MKILIAVTETTFTKVGLLRPGIPYALDPTKHADHDALQALFGAGGVGVELDDTSAAALLANGLGHHIDDVSGPVFRAIETAARADGDGDKADDAAPVDGDDAGQHAKPVKKATAK